MLNSSRDRRIAVLLALAGLALIAGIDLAQAQSPLGIGAAEPGIQIGGPFAGLFLWVNQHQQAFYRALTGALKAMRENPWALTSLIGLSFAYGIFHAAGPGHGKAVISSYMIANEIQLRRGVLIAFLSSFMQGIVAILLVAAAYLVLRGTTISMTQATQALETASFAMIALFGAWLIYKKLRSLRLTLPEPAPAELAAAGVTSHLFSDTEAESSHAFSAGSQTTRHHHHAGCGHDHHGAGLVCETCGHAHAPDPGLLNAERFDLREAWSAIIAVGLRPCSGALLVMTFSLLNGLYLGGALSVLAMSFGTAITVSALATLAVTAKGMALRFAGNGAGAAWIGHGIELLGAVFVLLMGLLLLGASLQGGGFA